MNVFSEILGELEEFDQLVKGMKEKKTPVNVVGVSDSVGAHLISSVCERLHKTALVVVAEDKEARQYYQDLRFFLGEHVYYFPRTDLLFYDVEAKGQDVTRNRLEVLAALLKEEPCCIVTTAEALVSATVPKDLYAKNSITLKVGEDWELDALTASLTALGYCREEMVEGPGQWSLRGGIVDIYPVTNRENPVRIEFFDTEVDSVRLFDPETQRTVEKMEEITILPARELLPDQVQRLSLQKTIDRLLSGLDLAQERGQKLEKTLKRDKERISQGMLFPSMDKYLPYLYEKLPTLTDYFSQEDLVFWCEPARIREKMERWEEQQAQDITGLAERGVLPEAGKRYAKPYREAVKSLTKSLFVGVSGISQGAGDYKPKNIYHINSKSLSGFQGRLDFLCESLDYYQKNFYRTVILAGTEGRAKALARQLEDEGIRVSYREELTDFGRPGSVLITRGSLRQGFSYPNLQVAVLGDREVFGDAKKKRKKPKVAPGDRISSFTQISPGDYIVHQSHGIGLYTGIEQLTVDGVRKDYLKIQYRGTDVLYVPTDQLDLVYKHTAKDGARVKVNKLGGVEWGRTKERVKAAAADMAKKLIALYAQRSQIPGIMFEKDTEWQHDFEAAFPYEETEDQLRAIQEVKADMEQPHPMDRLLCGDVGYGKTEVAMRAAFKAVMSGYQVAYLVPTTILASQHYNNFKQRMRNYPMRVGLLSRFVTGNQQKETLKGLSTGEVDIVIGTHKLLGKNVNFKKLGLLVIDEEQRFGVAHKEKIKELRQEVDVLTLSATPIPRTLHMSLSGIRDMSLIAQPPGERYPIATYVLEYDEEVIRDAIFKELARAGQVYYLFNRVEGIYAAANRIAELVPEARVAVAHGKMGERELEEIMEKVAEGEIDVLICTTIIETGLDIANVNTLIVEDADRLGLAQLYQLRGRVGRSNRLAYAYLTFRRNKVLTPDAEKRLLAIKEFTEFGSGFRIAMQDLEIRGTGNLIGAEQHGHLEAVGYEMYCQLLEQAVREQQGKEPEKKTETMIDLPVSAYIPEEYIASHNQRLGAYKRIAAISSQEELFDAYDEIEDRYGTVPQSVHNLMEVALLKAMAQKRGVAEIMGSGPQVIFGFDTENLPEFTGLLATINARPREFFLPSAGKPKLHYKLGKPVPGGEREYFAAIRQVLELLEKEPEVNMNNL